MTPPNQKPLARIGLGVTRTTQGWIVKKSQNSYQKIALSYSENDFA
jgi:hypothetical protein